MSSTLRFIICGLFVWLGVGIKSLYADTLTAQVDRTSISLEQTLNLRITYSGRSSEDPDLSALEQNFEILSRSHSSSFSVSNGQAVSSVRWNFTLAPKMAGQLLIPPLNLEGSQSKPISITVTEQAAPVQASDRDVFIESSIEKTTAYVQEQILVSFKFYYDAPVSRLEPTLFSVDQVQVKELPRAEYTATVGNRTYQVSEFKVAITVEKDGDITLPSTFWNAVIEDSGASMMGLRGGRGTVQRLKTDELHLKIKPKPANYPAGKPWLPAKSLSIDEQWSRPKDQLMQGDPVTRTLTINAVGLTAEQLPPIGENLSIDGIKIYPDKPQLETQTTSDGLVASRLDNLSIVPSQSGTLEIPAIEITWWDTQADQLRTASLPAQPLLIAPAAAPTAAMPSIPNAAVPTDSAAGQAAAQPSPQWPYWLMALLAVSNIVFCLLWLQARRQPNGTRVLEERPLKAKDLWPILLGALRDNNAKATREALIKWFHEETKQPFTNLTEIANWSNDCVLADAVTQLDSAMYGSAAAHWHGQTLLDALLSWRETQKAKMNLSDDLAPLY